MSDNMSRRVLIYVEKLRAWKVAQDLLWGYTKTASARN